MSNCQYTRTEGATTLYCHAEGTEVTKHETGIITHEGPWFTYIYRCVDHPISADFPFAVGEPVKV